MALFLGREFSLSWRVLDAQYLGIAQRHRRVFLVADFGGTTAPKILLKKEGLFGDSAQSGIYRQGAAAPAQGGADDTGFNPVGCVQSRHIFEETDTKGDHYGYNVAVIDLRNPTCSDGNNMLHLVNKHMDTYHTDKTVAGPD